MGLRIVKTETKPHNPAATKLHQDLTKYGLREEGTLSTIEEALNHHLRLEYLGTLMDLERQIRRQKDLRRRTKEISPQRPDMIREQDTAIEALQDLEKRLRKRWKTEAWAPGVVDG